jgi:molybdate/tungstate transport system permease protein
VRDAIALSLEGAFLSATLAALIGVPLAYGLARTTFPGKSVLAALVDLALAVPHTVAGIALLIVLGRQGVLGRPLQALVGLNFGHPRWYSCGDALCLCTVHGERGADWL